MLEPQMRALCTNLVQQFVSCSRRLDYNNGPRPKPKHAEIAIVPGKTLQGMICVSVQFVYCPYCLWLAAEIFGVSVIAGPTGALITLMWNRDQHVIEADEQLKDLKDK
jgi:hypothetical protein